MDAEPIIGTRRLGRGLLGLVVMGMGAVIAMAGQAMAAPRASSPGTIGTVAGGVGGPGPAMTVAMDACGVSADSGSIYIGGGSVVRRVDAQGLLTTPAGTGASAGPVGTHHPTTADLGRTCGVAVDSHGNLVLTESAHTHKDLVAVVAAQPGTYYGVTMKAGHIYNVAGHGPQGVTTSGAAARATDLGSPEDVSVDGNGNLVVAESGWTLPGVQHAAVVQVVAAVSGSFYGQQMTAGHIYDVAGYDQGNGFSGDGGPATSAALGQTIGQVSVDAAGNLVIADTYNDRVRVVAAQPGTFYGQPMTTGDIYTVAGDGTQGFAGDSGPATQAELNFPAGAEVDLAGNIVVGDSGNSRVRVVAARSGTSYGQQMTAGDIYTTAHVGGAGSIAVDQAGNVVATAGSTVDVVAAATGTFYGHPMTSGDTYTVAGNGHTSYSGDGGPATAAELDGPDAAVTDGAGNLLVADTFNYRVRVVAHSSGTYFGQPMTAGDIYTVAGDGTSGYSGDGGPGTSAGIGAVSGVAADATGNLILSDTGNQRVRVVAARSGTFYGQPMTAGDIYTVAGDGTPGFAGDRGPATGAELDLPHGVAVDADGNMVIGDSGNNRVRVLAAHTGTYYGQAMKSGDIYTVAGTGARGYGGDGGPATAAELAFPQGVAVDSAGNVVVADTYNSRVRLVAVKSGTYFGQKVSAGDVVTVAGDGNEGFTGDGGPATSAELFFPQAVAVDTVGNLVVDDTDNWRVRVVAAVSGTYYGQTITAGDIDTVAGDGQQGFSGDGAGAASAEISPLDVAADTAGGLLIADAASSRVRLVTG